MNGHSEGRNCAGWPHCYTPATDLRACLDEVSDLLDRGVVAPQAAIEDALTAIRAELEAR